jgi:hypothetical protein
MLPGLQPVPCFEMLCSTLRATHYLLKLYPCSRLRSQVSINVSARQYRVHGKHLQDLPHYFPDF